MEKNTKKISRRGFIVTAAIAAGCVVFKRDTSFWPDRDSRIKKFLAVKNVRQIVEKNNNISRCIMWQLEQAAIAPRLEIREKDKKKFNILKVRDDSFSDNEQINYQYSVDIDNLLPNNIYEYRICDEDKNSRWYDLKTANDDYCKALLFPDSQSNNYSDWKNLAQNAAKRNIDADFFINMGDLVDNGEDKQQWQAWFEALGGIIEWMPIAPIMGNHEMYDLKWQVRKPQAFLNYFIVPDNNSSKFKRYYYSFDYGPVHFSVLNSQWDELRDLKQEIIDEQKKWLRADMEHSAKKWKIVLIHKDVLSYRIYNRPERKEGFTDIGEIFMPLFDELGIDVVFTAHYHTYRNRGQIYKFKRADKGPFYIVTGVAGNVRYPKLWIDNPFDKVIAPQPETDNYLTLQANKEKLAVNCYVPDGKIIDNVTITK